MTILAAMIVLLLTSILLGASMPASVAGSGLFVFVADASTSRTEQMTKETVYKGRKIRLSAQRDADGRWRGAAEFLDDPRRTIGANTAFQTQSEAISAALSGAMAEVDKDRATRGKP